MMQTMTRRPIASLGLQAGVKRDMIHTAPQALPHQGADALAPWPDGFTSRRFAHWPGRVAGVHRQARRAMPRGSQHRFVPLKACTARRGRQAGFSLVEVSIVSAIVLLISMVAVPMISDYIIENKVPKVGEELLRFVVRMRVSGNGAGEQPYSGVSNALLASAMKQSSVLRVSGASASAVVKHGLGGGSGTSSGVVTLAPATVGSGAAGSAFKLTLNNVNNAACPGLASVLHQMASIVSITGGKTGGEVKNSTASPAVAYNPLLAESYCNSGDVNTFVFTVQ